MRLLLISLCVLASSCGAARCPAVLHASAEDLVDSYRRMRSPARVVMAEARVERRDTAGRIRGTVFMMLERPDHVRFDAMTQFGPAAVLTSDGTTFSLMDLRENRFFTGPTCAENIARLLGIPMEGEEVAGLILGQTPMLEGESDLVCEGGRYRVTVRAADGRSEVLEYAVREADVHAEPIDQRLRLMRAERFSGGEVEWRVTYDDYRVIEDPLDAAPPGESPRRGVAMPFRIRFEHPGQGIDTLVRVQSIELNAELPDGAFVQEPRPGLSIEPVECDG